MDLAKLNTLLELLEETSVSEFEYSDDTWKVKLRRTVHGSSGKASADVLDAGLTVPVPASTAQEITSSKHVMTAGLTGTFYRAPAPEQAPFVSIGDTVIEGQTVGVIEAMKLLNTIEADRAGRIVDIYADDGATVSPESILFTIEPLEAAHV